MLKSGPMMVFMLFSRAMTMVSMENSMLNMSIGLINAVW